MLRGNITTTKTNNNKNNSPPYAWSHINITKQHKKAKTTKTSVLHTWSHIIKQREARTKKQVSSVVDSTSTLAQQERNLCKRSCFGHTFGPPIELLWVKRLMVQVCKRLCVSIIIIIAQYLCMCRSVCGCV